MSPLPEYQYVERLREKIREMIAAVNEIVKNRHEFPFEIWVGLPDAEKPPVPRSERGSS
jgi:hypothetical protein